MATNDAGSGSSHRCQVMRGSSTTLMIPTMTHAEIYGLWVWMVGGVWVRKSRYGDGITWGCLLFLSSLPLFFGSWPSTNGVGMGFYHVRSQSSGGGFSPCTGSTEMSPSAVMNGCGTSGFVRLRTWNGCFIASFNFFPFLLFYGNMQPRRSAPKEGDNVTPRHVTYPGAGNACLI